jgi:predicted amidohydrolase
MRVAAFQFDVRRGAVGSNLAEVEEGLRRAASEHVRLVVLPEMWPTSFPDADESPEERVRETEEALARVAELSAELELVVCGSAFGGGLVQGRPCNRLHVFERGARVLEHDKVHLFSPTAEGEGFRAGDRPPATVQTRLGSLSGIVCYDLRFGQLVRAPFLAGAEILVVPAQWPSPRANHWRSLVIGRAVECQCFVVACNRLGTDHIGRRRLELVFPGNSLVVDPGGHVLAEGEGRSGLVQAEIDLEEARRLRRQVPVRKDERGDLYRDWEGI